MSKSKWNNKSSVSIENLTENELKEAISEWAEGSPQLEALLWNCYKNGIETTGCDAGDHHFAYLDILPDKSSDKMKKLINGAFNFGNSYIGYRRVGNPFSGPNWYMPVLDFSPTTNKDASLFFESLNLALEDESESVSAFYDTFLPLIEFFNEKVHNISFVLKVIDGCKYTFSFHCGGHVNLWEKLDDIFEKVKLRVVERNIERRSIWSYTTNSFEDVMYTVKAVYEVLKENEALFEDVLYDETIRFCSTALIMRKQFGTDRRGIELMNEWLNQCKYNSRVVEANY